MHYDRSYFDHPVDRRGTDCVKWDDMARREGRELLPMWIADMDLRCPAEVTEALAARAAHGIYGYPAETDRHIDAMLGFFRRRHGLSLTREQQFTLPCVITGLQTAVRVLTKPGDRVIIQSPVYAPFLRSVEGNGRIIADNALLLGKDGRYCMDFDGLEAQLRQGAALMILCNPHNPVGRCWTKAELTRLWELVKRYEIPLISDEIHWDFVYAKGAFTSMLSLVADPSAKLAVLTSASKTFNLAGLLQATLLSRNPELLHALSSDMENAGVTQGNIFSLAATEAAYREGDAWLDALLDYLRESQAILREELAKRLPQAILSPMEATYLAWVDLRAYGLTNDEIQRRAHAQNVAFVDGRDYGKTTGDGFIRICLACSHAQLREALQRLERAIFPSPNEGTIDK